MQEHDRVDVEFITDERADIAVHKARISRTRGPQTALGMVVFEQLIETSVERITDIRLVNATTIRRRIQLKMLQKRAFSVCSSDIDPMLLHRILSKVPLEEVRLIEA